MRHVLAIVALALVSSAAQAQPPNKTAQGSAAAPQGSAAAPQGSAAAPSTTPAVEEMAPRDVTRWLAFFDKLVDAVVLNAQSCDKMAADVSTVIDTNRSSIALARDARQHGRKLPRPAQEHMLDGVRRMGPGIENCSDNEKVKAAFSKLEAQ